MIRRIVKFIRNLRILPRWVIVLIDLTLIAFSSLLGYLLRFNFHFHDLEVNRFERGIAAYIICGLAAILITKSYNGIVRYTGIQDGVRISYMLLINLVLVAALDLIHFYNYQNNLIPYSVIFISVFSSFLLLFNYRLLIKQIFSYYRNCLESGVQQNCGYGRRG